MADDTTLLSTGEIARRLGVSLTLVQRLEGRGDLPPALRIAGSDRRVWPSDRWPEIVRRFEARRRTVRAAS